MTQEIVRGIDVSENNPRQPWTTHYAAGVRFMVAKATEGNHSRDRLFSAHMRDASQAKITVRGAYHFAWPNEDVYGNAANYIATVKPFAGPGFVHWLDLEPYPGDRRNYAGCTSADILHWVQMWIVLVSAAFPGQRVGVYGGASEDAHIPHTFPRWFPAYPWPVGTATYDRAAAHPRIRSGAQFWQFTGSPLDRSVWYGSLADLVKWAGGGDLGIKAPAPKPKPKPPAARPRSVRVKAGMTLGAIALILGSSVTALAHYNHIADPNRIYPGQVISAPPVAPVKPTPKPKPKPKPAAPAYTVHTVRNGETLSGIAAAAHIPDWHTLATYNHLTHPDRILPGQSIRIPKGH